MTPPLFSSHANATLERVKAVYEERGEQYSDSWRECQFVTMKSVARKLGIRLPDDDCLRALAAAAFVDMKFQRNAGAYKDDSLIDGIAYAAFLAEEMRALEP